MPKEISPDAADGMPASHLEPPVGEGPIERVCKYARQPALIAMLVVIGFAAILLWHFIRLELTSYRFGERAPTFLETPLWIPRLAMAIGVAALLFAIVRTFIAHVRRFGDLSRHGA